MRDLETVKIRTIPRADFIELADEILARLKTAGGDPAFIVFAWFISLGPAGLDFLGTTMSGMRTPLRFHAPKARKAVNALRRIKLALLDLKGLGFNADALVVQDQLMSLSRELDVVVRAHAHGRAAKKLGPRPVRARYVMVAALVTHLDGLKTDEWRWGIINDWVALVSTTWPQIGEAAGLRRIADARVVANKKLDHHRFRMVLQAILPEIVRVEDPLDLKAWWKTRATKTRNSLSQEAIAVGKLIANQWSMPRG